MPEPNEDPAAGGGNKDPIGGFITRGQALFALAVGLVVAVMIGLVKVVQSADETRFAFCDTSFELFCPDRCDGGHRPIERDRACYRECIKSHATKTDAAKEALEKCVTPKPADDGHGETAGAGPKHDGEKLAAAGSAAPAPAGSGAKPPIAGNHVEQHPNHPQPPPKNVCPAARELFAVAQSVMASCRPPTEVGSAWTVALSYDATGLPQVSLDGTQSNAMCKRMLLAKPDVKQARPGCRYRISSEGTVSHE